MQATSKKTWPQIASAKSDAASHRSPADARCKLSEAVEQEAKGAACEQQRALASALSLRVALACSLAAVARSKGPMRAIYSDAAGCSSPAQRSSRFCQAGHIGDVDQSPARARSSVVSMAAAIVKARRSAWDAHYWVVVLCLCFAARATQSCAGACCGAVSTAVNNAYLARMRLAVDSLPHHCRAARCR